MEADSVYGAAKAVRHVTSVLAHAVVAWRQAEQRADVTHGVFKFKFQNSGPPGLTFQMVLIVFFGTVKHIKVFPWFTCQAKAPNQRG